MLVRRVCGRKRAFKMFIDDWPWCTLLPLEGETCWDGASSLGAGAMFRPGSLRVCSGHAGGRGEVRAAGVGRRVLRSLRARACCSLVSGLVDAPFVPPSGWGWGPGAVGAGAWQHLQSTLCPHTLAQDGRLRGGSGRRGEQPFQASPGVPRGKGPSPAQCPRTKSPLS